MSPEPTGAPGRPSPLVQGKARMWWGGARPRTLGAGVVPVLVGTAAVAERFVPWRFGAALVVALGLQVGVNYANDYADGVRGVDAPGRVGPPRLVGSGTASPRAVAVAAGVALGVAAVAGAVLALATAPWLLLVGVLALAAAVLYSGGPRPYAGMGLGEVAVFVFFGLVPTAGTAYVQARTVPAAAWWGGVAVGLLAVAILMANNLRDIGTDAAVGKRTLAVRLGDRRTRRLFAAVVVGAQATLVLGLATGGLPLPAALALLAAPLGVRALNLSQAGQGPQLVRLLLATAAFHLAFGVLLAAGLAWEAAV